ncbi:MAG TPA: sigma-54 dependent transcriptional regulator [Candidatus Acidoferrales bacterium]|nr:sigma-54 dependent transcriptional regulator [Candidatus Acidoferrales bacterium]
MADSDLISVLLVEDEEYDVLRVKNTIKPFSDRIRITDIVSDGNDALDLIKCKSEIYDVVIMDLNLSGGLMGEKLIQEIKEAAPSLPIIVITKMTINITDYNFANKLMRAGAFWYGTKYPGDIEFIYQPTDFILSIINASEKSRIEKAWLKSNQKLVQNVQDILEDKKIIGVSEQTVELKEDIAKYAKSDVNILISGSSGTGKELVAYNIHYNSARRFENFIPINCGGLPSELVESELFGYERGAFTGADKKKPGLFEVANNGTIFLDEITELPLSAQVKLLRVIQDGELEKIGRTGKIKVDVRIIAATNRNIEEEVRAKRFREDLYYRLNVVFIHVPDLINRKDDIPVLIDHFLMHYSASMVREKPILEEEALRVLTNYSWPGNVRELKNVVQRLMFTNQLTITAAQARRALGTPTASGDSFESIFRNNPLPLAQMERMLREKYFEYVRNSSSSDTEAAMKLGLAPSNYYRMAKQLGLK